MILDDRFGKTISCECGEVHHIKPSKVVYSEDAVDQLPELANAFHLGPNVAVIMDIRTKVVAGDRTVEVFEKTGFKTIPLVVKDRPNGTWPICDDITHKDLDDRIGRVDWIVTVGSGVINDLGKWLAGNRDIPFLSFATAASMNGYGSTNVAPTIKGMKSLTFAKPPLAVLSCPSILQEAPYKLTTAGLGDVLAKSISTTDWYMNHLLFEDHYCSRSAGLIAEIEPLYLDCSEDLKEGKPGAMEALFHALLLTGVSMNMAETSSPASGAEHLISHSLDMLDAIDGKKGDLHGRQVGLGTVLMAALYQMVLKTESPCFMEPKETAETSFWGPLGGVVQKNFSGKADRLHLAGESLKKGDAWDQLRKQLSLMPHPPETLQQCLSRAKAAVHAEDIGCSRDRLLSALLHAHEIRPRFTVLDLAYLVGIMPAAAEMLVDAWS